MQQKANTAKKWSLQTMPPSPKSSICSNLYHQEQKKDEETEQIEKFSELIKKVEVCFT